MKKKENGEAMAVLMDIKAYQDTEDAFTLMCILRLAEKDIEEGRIRDAKEVFKEIEEEYKQKYGK